MSVRLEGEDLATCIGYGSRMGWPAGTKATVTLTVETKADGTHSVFVTIEKQPAEENPK